MASKDCCGERSKTLTGAEQARAPPVAAVLTGGEGTSSPRPRRRPASDIADLDGITIT